MISILIPCYDYNAYPLVSNIEKQALVLNINFEIICIDDGSFSSKNELNQKINSLTNAKFIESRKNAGRVKNRLLLAEKSQYDWLLFIDVDTMPEMQEFLKIYLSNAIKNNLVFGGCKYSETNKGNTSLRKKYGKNREEINSKIRSKNPYKYISSMNFFGKKTIIINTLAQIETNSYGNDYVFGSILKKDKVKILHIDNPVIVKGIDSNQVFINKTKDALTNLLNNYKKNKIRNHSISILKAYTFLNTLFLKNIFLSITNLIKNRLEENLISKNPNLFLFDLYRLRFLCELKNF
tara:strand:+ start:545 stop:1426 length:882 start_codon:yes stop_codon:yes gene_type:complete